MSRLFLVGLIIFLMYSCKESSVYKSSDYNPKSYVMVTLDEVSTNPDTYDSQKVILEGKFYFSIENSFISPGINPEDGVWIDFRYNDKLLDGENINLLDGVRRHDYSGKRVRVMGTFDSQFKGHLSSSNGSLKDIVYFEIK